MPRIIAGDETIAVVGSILEAIRGGLGMQVMESVRKLSDLYLPALLQSVASGGDDERRQGGISSVVAEQ